MYYVLKRNKLLRSNYSINHCLLQWSTSDVGQVVSSMQPDPPLLDIRRRSLLLLTIFVVTSSAFREDSDFNFFPVVGGGASVGRLLNLGAQRAFIPNVFLANLNNNRAQSRFQQAIDLGARSSGGGGGGASKPVGITTAQLSEALPQQSPLVTSIRNDGTVICRDR